MFCRCHARLLDRGLRFALPCRSQPDSTGCRGSSWSMGRHSAWIWGQVQWPGRQREMSLWARMGANGLTFQQEAAPFRHQHSRAPHEMQTCNLVDEPRMGPAATVLSGVGWSQAMHAMKTALIGRKKTDRGAQITASASKDNCSVKKLESCWTEHWQTEQFLVVFEQH